MHSADVSSSTEMSEDAADGAGYRDGGSPSKYHLREGVDSMCRFFNVCEGRATVKGTASGAGTASGGSALITQSVSQPFPPRSSSLCSRTVSSPAPTTAPAPAPTPIPTRYKALAELTRELMKTDSRSLKRWGREDVVKGAASNGSVAKRLSVGWSLSDGYVDKKKASYKPPTAPVPPPPPVS